MPILKQSHDLRGTTQRKANRGTVPLARAHISNSEEWYNFQPWLIDGDAV